MPKVTFVAQSAQNQQNVAANPARLLNLYPSPVPGDARTGLALRSVLGQDAKDDIGTAAIRAAGRANGKLWMVGGGTLLEVDSAGATTGRGAVADDENTTIAGNYSDVTVVSGGNYYLWDGATISQPTTKTFTAVGSHCYVGGYTVLTEEGGKRFQWSALGDASTLDALDFASADKVDDNILRAVEFRGNLLLMCETSTETWAINPDATDTAARFFYVDVTNTGLKSFNLVTKFDDALFFVGNDNRAYLYGQGRVSDTSVESSIKNDTPTHCFYYEDEGSKFCVIRFSERPAWVYDMSTGLWHERSEGAGHLRWRATCAIRNGASWLIGNTDGEVLELTRSNEDLNGPLYRRAISSTITLGERRVSVPFVEILARMGDHSLTDSVEYALSVGDGDVLALDGGDSLLVEEIAAGPRDANIDLYESGDGGRTWRGPKTRSMGRDEDYEQRMTWRARGQFRQYAMRFDMNEPADITLYSDGYVQAT